METPVLTKEQEEQFSEFQKNLKPIDWAKYQGFLGDLETMQKFNLIISQMKEEPNIPSESHEKDKFMLTKVEFEEGGGVFTYGREEVIGKDGTKTFEEKKYPYRGFPYGEFVDKVDLLKKMSRGTLSGLYHELKKSKWKLALSLPALWMVKPAVRSWVYNCYRVVYRFRIRPNRYSRTIQELWRTMSLPVKGEKSPEFREQLRLLLCMILEFDNAYRFRFQDIVQEIDKKAMERNPRKEIVRLFSVMQSREKTEDIRDTWKLMKYGVSVYLWLDKETVSILKSALSNLNLAQAKLTVEDEYWCEKRQDYNFKHYEKVGITKDNELQLLNQQRNPGLQVR